MLSFTAIRDVLQRSRSIAIVGAKDKAGQPVDRVGRYLLDKGYTIFPVHPVRKTVWGLTAYPDLASLPQPVDIIDLFRAPQYCPAHAPGSAGPALEAPLLLDAGGHPLRRGACPAGA